MALTKSILTGRVVLPTDAAPINAELVFTLSGLDSEGGDILPPGDPARCVLINGELPAGYSIWRNTEGYRGTHYIVTVMWTDMTRHGIRETIRELGKIQVGDNASYVLADLLAEGTVPAGETFWSAITEAEYDAVIDAAAVLDGFASRDLVTFMTNAAISNGRGPYALPYNPRNVKYIDLRMSGITQAPTTAEGGIRDFDVVSMPMSPSGYGVQFTADWPSGIVCDCVLVRPIDDIPGATVPTPGIYESRALVQVFAVPVTQTLIFVRHGGHIIAYEQDPTGTALISGNGIHFSPAFEVTPLHWGAIVDDTTSDSAAIQAAITYASTTTLRVFFPSGIYRVSTPALIPVEKMVLEGAGFENTILRVLGTFPDAAYIIRTDPAVASETAPLRRSTIRQMRFEGGAGAIRASGIGLIDSALHTVEYCVFQGTRKGLYISASAPLTDITVFQPGGPLLSKNRFACTEAGIHMVGNTQNFVTENWFITGCANPIILENTDKTRVICNEFNDWTGSAAVLLTTTDPTLTTKSNLVHSNAFHGHGAPSIVELGAGTDWNSVQNNFMIGGDPITMLGSNSICRNNVGFVTENSSTATILAGTTFIVVSHGLNSIKGGQDVQVTPRMNIGGANTFWTSNVTSTDFRINVAVAPVGVDWTFAWSAVRLNK